MKMFTIDMREKNAKYVPLPSVTLQAFGEILNSIYINKITFSKQNFSEILYAATLMEFLAMHSTNYSHKALLLV